MKQTTCDRCNKRLDDLYLSQLETHVLYFYWKEREKKHYPLGISTYQKADHEIVLCKECFDGFRDFLKSANPKD